MTKTVYIGKSYKNAIISKRKPKNSIKIGETKHYRRYALGVKEYLVAKPGFKLVRDKK